MIDYPGQELDRMVDPGVPDDIKWLGGGIAQATHWMKKVYDALRRQESPNPSLINLNPDGTGTNVGRIKRNTTRMRAYAFQFSGGTASEEFALFIGSAAFYNFFVPASPAPFTIPMDIPLDAGVDVQVRGITTPTAVNWRAYLWAYTELEDGGDA